MQGLVVCHFKMMIKIQPQRDLIEAITEIEKRNRPLHNDNPPPPRNFQKTTNLLDLVRSTTTETAISNMENLLDNLKNQQKYPIFYIFDEHNELFKKRDGGKSHIGEHNTFLGRFTQWTGSTGGVSVCPYFTLTIVQKRTITVYIGSAHSRFEFKLPGGEDWRLRFLQPLSETEAETLISTPNTVCSSCKLQQLIMIGTYTSRFLMED